MALIKAMIGLVTLAVSPGWIGYGYRFCAGAKGRSYRHVQYFVFPLKFRYLFHQIQRGLSLIDYVPRLAPEISSTRHGTVTTAAALGEAIRAVVPLASALLVGRLVSVPWGVISITISSRYNAKRNNVPLRG